jgi:hypothetical protein
MELRFYQDPQSGQPDIYQRGVSESEVLEMLEQPGEDRPATDNSRISIGQTSAGRHLRVIYIFQIQKVTAFSSSQPTNCAENS